MFISSALTPSFMQMKVFSLMMDNERLNNRILEKFKILDTNWYWKSFNDERHVPIEEFIVYANSDNYVVIDTFKLRY